MFRISTFSRVSPVVSFRETEINSKLNSCRKCYCDLHTPVTYTLERPLKLICVELNRILGRTYLQFLRVFAIFFTGFWSVDAVIYIRFIWADQFFDSWSNLVLISQVLLTFTVCICPSNKTADFGCILCVCKAGWVAIFFLNL